MGTGLKQAHSKRTKEKESRRGNLRRVEKHIKEGVESFALSSGGFMIFSALFWCNGVKGRYGNKREGQET